MQKLNFGGGVTKHIPTAKPKMNSRDIANDVNPQDIKDVIDVTFTIIELIKMLVFSIKNWFKKK